MSEPVVTPTPTPEPKPADDVEGRVRGLAKELDKARKEAADLRAAQESDAKKREEEAAKAKGEWEKVASLAKADADKAKAELEAERAAFKRTSRIMAAEASGLDKATAIGIEVLWSQDAEKNGEYETFLAKQLEERKISAPRMAAPPTGAPAHGAGATGFDALKAKLKDRATPAHERRVAEAAILENPALAERLAKEGLH